MFALLFSVQWKSKLTCWVTTSILLCSSNNAILWLQKTICTIFYGAFSSFFWRFTACAHYLFTAFFFLCSMEIMVGHTELGMKWEQINNYRIFIFGNTPLIIRQVYIFHLKWVYSVLQVTGGFLNFESGILTVFSFLEDHLELFLRAS